MPSIFDVAKYILEKSGSMTSNKLQKLCYYAQGFYLALHNGERLFDNDLYAWQHGPVVPELYHKYKSEHAACLVVDKDFDVNRIPEDVRSFLDDIYQTYGQFSAWRLREMTHQESPWINSYNRTPNDIIDDRELISFFRTRLVQ